MSVSYRGHVATLFEALAEGLAPFVDARMTEAFPDEDWMPMAADKLGKRRDVLVSLSDPHFQLEAINRWWGPVFAPVLGARTRQIINDLRTARNFWAHPDEAHPFDFAYSLQLHLDAEDLLRAIGSPQADEVARLAERLRWEQVRDKATSTGMSERDALMEQFTELQKQYDDLQGQLALAQDQAQTASGRQRAISRQLADLQSQYAAVSGLRDQYLSVQRLITADRNRRDGTDDDLEDPEVLRQHLLATEQTLVSLQERSDRLQEELLAARISIADVDPMQTDEGKRWIWLVAGLLLVLALLMAMAASRGAI